MLTGDGGIDRRWDLHFCNRRARGKRGSCYPGVARLPSRCRWRWSD